MREFVLDFKAKWFLYLSIAIIIVVLQCFALDAATKPGENERVSVFLTCYSVDEQLSASINESLPEGIRSFDVGSFDPENTFYAPYFTTFGRDADLVALPQKFSDMCDCEKYFASIDEEEITSRFGNVEFFYYNGKAYGIKIFDKNTKTGIATDYIQYCREGQEENIYLFFGLSSRHIGKLSESSIDDAALVILEKIWQSSK